MNDSRARIFQTAILVLVASFAVSVAAQTGNETSVAGPPTASDGGKAELLPPRPLADADDTLNQRVATQTVDGLVIVLTIDEANITLDSVELARVPRRQARAIRNTAGDQVKVVGLSGGREISTTVVPDTVLNASEDTGLVRTVKRQISVALAADQPLDAVRVEAPATSASALLDVRGAYARICEADPRSKWCPSSGTR
ncbi:MAG TPA: hypothetical protein PKC03_03270 [Dokdonella sp.]|nr:hypothetical protein [Dokdonella sp.]